MYVRNHETIDVPIVINICPAVAYCRSLYRDRVYQLYEISVTQVFKDILSADKKVKPLIIINIHPACADVAARKRFRNNGISRIGYFIKKLRIDLKSTRL